MFNIHARIYYSEWKPWVKNQVCSFLHIHKCCKHKMQHRLMTCYEECNEFFLTSLLSTLLCPLRLSYFLCAVPNSLEIKCNGSTSRQSKLKNNKGHYKIWPQIKSRNALITTDWQFMIVQKYQGVDFSFKCSLLCALWTEVINRKLSSQGNYVLCQSRMEKLLLMTGNYMKCLWLMSEGIG